jgi:hypothetical protein
MNDGNKFTFNNSLLLSRYRMYDLVGNRTAPAKETCLTGLITFCSEDIMSALWSTEVSRVKSADINEMLCF